MLGGTVDSIAGLMRDNAKHIEGYVRTFGAKTPEGTADGPHRGELRRSVQFSFGRKVLHVSL